MSKKKEKDLVLESPGVSVRESDKDFEHFKSSSSALTPLRGETIKLITIDDGCFDNTQKQESKKTDLKKSSESKRRLRLLK